MHILKTVPLVLVIIVLLVVVIFFVITNGPTFGKLPSGERLERIKKSPNYRDGAFQNLEDTPAITSDDSMLKIMLSGIFNKVKDRSPKEAFHFTKQNLKEIPTSENVLVWMGHSSYYLQVDGKRMLIDPVFSGYSSPFSFMVKAFKGSDLYTPDDIPSLDYLFISHDHWDHLDYKTVKAIFPKVRKVITGLGTGAHLEHWGLEKEKLTELDWGEATDLDPGFHVTGETARHFSGRSIKRNQAIWMSFVLKTPSSKIYLGGDSGYGKHFKAIGDHYGPFDLVILENGQFSENWKHIHMLPGEHVMAMKDLRSTTLLPVHNSKFDLAQHSWKEPMSTLIQDTVSGIKILTPQIGEKLDWKNSKTNPWWEGQK